MSYPHGEQLRSHPDLYILGARIHDAAAGRFLSPDPIFMIVNQYQYAHGNPVAYSDPSGLDPIKAYAWLKHVEHTIVVPQIVIGSGVATVYIGFATIVGGSGVVAVSSGGVIVLVGLFVTGIGYDLFVTQINSTFGMSPPTIMGAMPPIWGDHSSLDDSFPTRDVATEVWIPLPSTITMMGGPDGNAWCFTCNGGQCSSC
jgi:RHS repeat-associated protein